MSDDFDDRRSNGSRSPGDDRAGEDLLEAIPGIIAVLTLGAGVTSAVLGFGHVTPVIFVVGWLLLTPLSAILADTWQVRSMFSDGTAREARGDADAIGDDEAALEELKRRYARGEIDEAEFERRTELLVENESIDAVEDRVDRRNDAPAVDANSSTVHDDHTSGERERADRDRDPEFET
jgi:uncharacterized membrane protein